MRKDIKRSLVKLFLVFTCASLAMISCDEIAPSIDKSKSSDTTFVQVTIPVSDAKVVLVEEFTGVACLNCKDGHDEIDNLKSTYGARIVAVSIHALDVFSDPSRIAHSVPDLRSEDGTNAAKLYGLPNALPSAAIDRTIFDGETDVALSLNKWAGNIATRFAATSPVNINIQVLAYDSLSHELTFEVEVIVLENIDEEIAVSIAVAEDGVVAPQLDGSDWLEEYEQPHVLRDYLTAHIGKALNASNIAGRTYQFRFTEALDSTWDLDHLELISFVHYAGDENLGYQVLQAAAEHVGH